MTVLHALAWCAFGYLALLATSDIKKAGDSEGRILWLCLLEAAGLAVLAALALSVTS